ncbi:hypothetical protein ACN2MM_02460 [Alkalilimnicola ehrlichii MLHE-1]|uniref:hypothetical protein n=1 Tax=Alkalilimnicola ehrlichii TaxID=351052 RepID=UPI0012EA1BC2|nr:hypothetical protein [Alkalilimnicola ehrlichii]
MSDCESSQWRDALEAELKATDKTDLVIPYGQIAKAFPSSNPHPRTFEHPMIDDVSLRNWGSERGWCIDLASEILPEGSDSLPPVRFYKEHQ